MNPLRQDALSIWNASVDAVRAKPLVQKSVRIQDHRLVIDNQQWDLSLLDRIVIVGAGKAATAMADGLVSAFDGCLPITGWINVPQGTQSPIDSIIVHAARPKEVNEPTDEGVIGTQAIMDLVATANEKDLCIALISGGGSALLPAPVDGITLADKLAVTRHLSSAGANIAELNTARKHLSRVKGGGLLRACRAGHLITLVLSDVLGDPLDLIASGPTVPDTSTPQDALDIINRFDPQRSLPTRIRSVLETATARQANASGQHAPTAQAGVPDGVASTTLVIGNNAVAVDAARRVAQSFGYQTTAASASECEGDAESVGRQIADQIADWIEGHTSGTCQISGGEPTVKLAPVGIRGKGGRNQQLVLAAYLQLCQHDLSDQQWDRVVVLSGGTDGEDGPTAAAGAFIDATVHRRIVEQKLNGHDYLHRNDAFTFFDAVGGLLVTGPTGTNVCDVRVSIVAAAQS